MMRLFLTGAAFILAAWFIGNVHADAEVPQTATTAARKDVPVIVVNDFMCGLHRVQVNDFSGLMVDGQPYGDYKTTMLDAQNNYVHQFGEKAEVRVTQYSRVAFRLAGETRWAACKPLVFQEGQTR